MPIRWSSRERMLAALKGEQPDYVPLSFMIFTALEERMKKQSGHLDPAAMIETQTALGLDAFVDLRYFTPENTDIGHADAPGFPVRFSELVTTREYAKVNAQERYPLLIKEYKTPDGTLTVSVHQTNDWPYGDVSTGDYRIPFMDDFLAPRCRKYLVEAPADLKYLKHLLAPPSKQDLSACRTSWQKGKKLAEKNQLLLAGGWGVGADALAWFCGLQNAVLMAIENPEFFSQILSAIDQWNRPRMSAYLDFGVDLFIRRAWYEGTDFWSPDIFREFFLPTIKKEVQLAHQASTKYGYILTSGSMEIHNMLIEAGIDV